MVVDKNGKLFGKINLIDLLIVLIVLAGVAGLTYKFTRTATITPISKQDNIQIVLSTESVKANVFDTLAVGDVVKDWGTKNTMGKVIAVSKDKSRVYGTNDQGQMTMSEKPGYISILVTIEAKGTAVVNGSTTVGNIEYFVNRSVEAVIGDAVIYSTIDSIQKQ